MAIKYITDQRAEQIDVWEHYVNLKINKEV